MQSGRITALDLYAWNAQVSAALLAPLHLCEVVIRNAVSEALEDIYGARWPWSRSFEQSLPEQGGYSPKRDLINARRQAQTTGKVIPELKFVFWQKLFTARHDQRIWNRQLHRILPNLDSNQAIPVSRYQVYNELEALRKLRNRIAHHEPIFKRSLRDDFDKIMDLIYLRCSTTKSWAEQNQQASQWIWQGPCPEWGIINEETIPHP